MNDPWKILGIEKTSDTALIKTAFAKMLKDNPPDKDPEKYQQIRQAYQDAINESKKLNSEKSDDDFLSSQENREFQEKPDSDDFLESHETEVQPEVSEIKKIRDNLFEQKTISLADLVKTYKIYPIKKMSDQRETTTQTTNSSKNSSGSNFDFWKMIRLIRIIIGIIALIIALSRL